MYFNQDLFFSRLSCTSPTYNFSNTSWLSSPPEIDLTMGHLKCSICALLMTDSTTTEGWMHKLNFNKACKDPLMDYFPGRSYLPTKYHNFFGSKSYWILSFSAFNMQLILPFSPNKSGYANSSNAGD
jgi:hypothetical protein